MRPPQNTTAKPLASVGQGLREESEPIQVVQSDAAVFHAHQCCCQSCFHQRTSPLARGQCGTPWTDPGQTRADIRTVAKGRGAELGSPRPHHTRLSPCSHRSMLSPRHRHSPWGQGPAKGDRMRRHPADPSERLWHSWVGSAPRPPAPRCREMGCRRPQHCLSFVSGTFSEAAKCTVRPLPEGTRITAADEEVRVSGVPGVCMSPPLSATKHWEAGAACSFGAAVSRGQALSSPQGSL